jgi:hypothetical protein
MRIVFHSKRRRRLRRCLIGAAVVLTLTAAACIGEDWHGQRGRDDDRVRDDSGRQAHFSPDPLSGLQPFKTRRNCFMAGERTLFFL